MKLHLGCGPKEIPGWYHIDMVDYPHIDDRHAVDSLPMIQGGSVEVIYACHVLEHFYRREVPRVLEEWRRVLRPGGTLRLSVPDFCALASLYRDQLDLDYIHGPIMGRGDYGYNIHHSVWDEETLKRELQRAGFKESWLYDWRKTEHADMDDWSQSYYPHMDKNSGRLLSLNMEAVR